MYKIIIALLPILFMACSNQADQPAANGPEHTAHHPGASDNQRLQLNNGNKWKTDDATKKNVEAMAKIVDDSIYTDARNASQLTNKLNAQTDNLIKECRMSGPDHEALHTWLKQVLYDTRKISEEEPNEYQKLRQVLKEDMQQFYVYFE